MSKILISIVFLVCTAWFGHTLRLSLKQTNHLDVPNPNTLPNPTPAESTVMQSLNTINNQIGTINATVAASLYIPSYQNGQTQLTGYTTTPTTLPANTAQYCVVLSQDQLTTAQNTTLLIQSEINAATQNVLSLGPENSNRQTLANITNAYNQQN
jgi:hypothetical protein